MAEQEQAAAPEPTVYELVGQHLADQDPEAIDDKHLTISDYAAARGLEKWQVNALVARFHAQGMHPLARLPEEIFKQALDEALHGRV